MKRGSLSCYRPLAVAVLVIVFLCSVCQERSCMTANAESEISLCDSRFSISEDCLVVDSVTCSVRLSELLSALPDRYEVTLYKDGCEQEQTVRIATGMEAEIRSGDGATYRLHVCVRGDVNGDGMLTQTDAICVLRYLVGLQTLGESELAAADVVNVGRVTQTDAVQIRRWAAAYDSTS